MKTILNIVVMLWFASTTLAQQTQFDTDRSFGYLDSIGERLSIIQGDAFLNNQMAAPCNTKVLLPVFYDSPGFRDSSLTPEEIVIQDPVQSVTPVAGDINIYWIHGLNGTTESWALPANATEYGTVGFPARKAHSIIGGAGQFVGPAYSENYGISYAADNWDGIGDQQLVHTQKDFIIAHSQGGIVAREWLRKMDDQSTTHERHAYGLVTFGTPHAGAMILNNTREELGNRTPAFFNEACVSLGSALVIPKINQSFITSLLISDRMRDMIISQTCNIASNNLIPFVIDNYHKRTTLDYYVGSPFLTGYNTSQGHVQGLSEDQINVPVVQFYGVEEDPILWRFMASQLNIGDKQYGNPNLYFAYDQDDQLMNKVSNLRSEYTANYNYESNMYDQWSNKNCIKKAVVWGVLAPTVYTICKIEKERSMKAKRENMNAYNKAIVWLTNANEYYKTLLVGSRIETTVPFCVSERRVYCRHPDVNPVGSGVPAKYYYSITERAAGSGGCSNVVNKPITYTSYGVGTCTGTETVTTAYRIRYSHKENDGVVLAESARKQLNVHPFNTHFIVRMEGTNHDQMKNSSKTKEALTDLYDGEYGPLFKVDIR